MSGFQHLDGERLTAYLLGKLSWSEIENIEGHLGSCADCRARVGVMEESADSFVSCLRGDTGMPDDETAMVKLMDCARAITEPTVSFVDVVPRKVVAGCELLDAKGIAGGLGVVYKAYHRVLKDFRAIKRPRTRDRSERDILFERFQREVEAVGALRHDHIVRAHDAGSDAEGPYLVMEYLDGKSLSGLVAQQRLSAADACELIRQAALGLQAAHECGLVHRDIKPSNLMLARASGGVARAVVIDWGLATRRRPTGPNDHAASDTLTPSGAAVGTADYIAPEQARDAATVDIRADVYSLGVTLYCLLTGHPPFRDRSVAEKLLAHQREAFPPIERLREDIPVKLVAVIKKMVEKDPSKRFATPAEVVTALKPFCCAEPRLIDLLEKQVVPPISPKRSQRTSWLVAAAAILALTSVSLGLLVRDRTSPDPEKVQSESGVLGAGPATPEPMLHRHIGDCTSIAFLADGLRAVSEDGGGAIVIWDLRKRDRQEIIPHYLEKPLPKVSGMIAASPDGTFVAAAGVNVGLGVDYMDSISLFDQKTYKRTGNDYRFGSNRLSGVMAFSSDGSKLAVVEQPGIVDKILEPFLGGKKINLSVLDIHAGKWVKMPVESPIRSLAFSPDGRYLIASSDKDNLVRWSLGKKDDKHSFAAHKGGADQVQFSADGTRIYSASSADDTLRVWTNDQDNREVKQIPLGKIAAKMVRCALWPKGRALTAHRDGSMVVWDLDTGEEMKRFQHKDVQITSVAISPDGYHAVAAHSDGNVFLYRLPTPRVDP